MVIMVWVDKWEEEFRREVCMGSWGLDFGGFGNFLVLI